MRRLATITGLVLLSSTADLAPRAPAYGQPVATPAPVAQSERAEPDRSSAASTPTAPAQLPAATAAEATAPTTPELLGRHFALQLPAHVALAAFEVTALVNQGTPADPLYKARFKATAELLTPTFEEVGRIGPVTWLQLVRGPGDRARLHGTATATRAVNEPWQVELALELNPLPRLGQPREALPGVTAVRGSEEEKEFFGRLTALARDRLALELPGHWRLGRFELGESALAGDRIALRFIADLSLLEPTYLETETIPETVLLTRVAEAGTERRLTGRAEFRHEGGRWLVDLQVDRPQGNAPDLGRPLGAFEGRVLVEGSAEEKAWREAARRQREAERRQREIAALRAALEGQDGATRASAFTTAVASNDPTLRQMALSQWLKTTSRVALQIEQADPAGQQSIRSGLNTFALDFAAYDEASGTFTGRVVAPIENPSQELAFSGKLAGEALSFASPRCQGTLRLAEGGFLEGELRCGGLRTPSLWGGTLEGVFRVAVPLR